MTEQTPIAMTRLHGANADYVDQLQPRFAADPEIDAKRAPAGIVVAESPAGLGQAVLAAIKG